MTGKDRVEELEEKVQELTEELEKVKDRKAGEEKEKEAGQLQDAAGDSGISRRKFMKMIGGGAAGLSAAAVLPSVSGFTFRDDSSFKFGNMSSSQANMEVGTGGDLDMHGNDISNLSSLTNVQNHINIEDRGGDRAAPDSGLSFYVDDGKLKAVDANGERTIPVETFSTESTVIGQGGNYGDGGDLGALINDLIADGITDIEIRKPVSGNVWTWDTDITLNPINYDGISVTLGDSVAVEYTGTGTPLTLDSGGDISGQIIEGKTFSLHGGRFTTANNTGPFAHLKDMVHASIQPHFLRNFGDGSTVPTILLEAVDKWVEANTVKSWIRGADVGVEYRSSNGDYASFVDNKLHVEVSYQDTGLKIGGAPSGTPIIAPTLFPDEDNSTAIEFNGRHQGVAVISPRLDATGTSYSNAVAFGTGPNFDRSRLQSVPVIQNGNVTDQFTLTDYEDGRDRIYWQTAEDAGRSLTTTVVDRGIADAGLLDRYIDDDFGDGAFQARSGMVLGSYRDDDGTLHENAAIRPQWNVDEGSPTFNSDHIEFPGNGQDDAVTVPCAMTQGTWEAEVAHLTENGSSEWVEIDIIRKGDGNRWYMRLGDNATAGAVSGEGKIQLRNTSNGTVVGDNWIIDNSYHTLKATHDGAGNWELFLDGTSIGTASDGYMPADPTEIRVGDLTFGTDDDTQAIRALRVF